MMDDSSIGTLVELHSLRAQVASLLADNTRLRTLYMEALADVGQARAAANALLGALEDLQRVLVTRRVLGEDTGALAATLDAAAKASTASDGWHAGKHDAALLWPARHLLST